MPKNAKSVVWPAYIDAHRTRKEGRILAKQDSVGAPDVKEIIHAANELGLNPTYEDEKAYPRLWWGHKGRLRIDAKGPKRSAIRRIARAIKATRAQAILEDK